MITFGCRVNQADSLGVEEQLRGAGGEAAPPEEADVVVVNTCSVTASADQGARQTIRRIARVNPAARIVVTGCYATREPEPIAALPNVVRVVRNDDKGAIVRLVREGRLAADPAGGLSTADRYAAGDGSCGAPIEPGVAGRTAFTLRVQIGCAEACSYCIIPSTRGRPRSVPIGEVLREVERVADAGFKEIALTGVHLGSYGRDLTPQSSLSELLAALATPGLKGRAYVPTATPGLKGRAYAPIGTPGLNGRAYAPTGTPGPNGLACDPAPLLFRISSLEPMDCSPEIVDLVASCGAFAPHFHLPLQHASNRMLAAMRRPYTIEYYAALVDDIRARMPGASIGSDVIAGFPGETDEDFEELASYLERSPLTHLHVFPYSDRPGTEATAMSGKVSGTVIRERGRRLRAIGGLLTANFHRSQVGAVHRALTLEDGSLVVTGNYLKLRIPAGRARNEWVRVRVASDHHGELLPG